jgi:hypothetical protein
MPNQHSKQKSNLAEACKEEEGSEDDDEQVAGRRNWEESYEALLVGTVLQCWCCETTGEFR